MKTETIRLKGVEVKFSTRPGVFSAHGLDSGTKLLIDAFNISDNTLVADLGSGTGMIGLVAAKLNPHGYVHLLDDHLRSVNLAKENVELNNLSNVEVFASDLFSGVGQRTYHQIYCNPPAQMGNEFLEELIYECFKHLKTKGELWLVIVKHLKEPMKRLLETAFGHATIVTAGKEHVVFKAQKEGNR